MALVLASSALLGMGGCLAVIQYASSAHASSKEYSSLSDTTRSTGDN